ncbi:MAG: hypothetical protein Q8916_03165 [Bacteroidota bacterium]|nr:hypothetical protein [Bacteroidota bacterium]MDP4229388.1 hypothetical protein [Bacteroidota bacterium]MDP4235180.1 hypothetical protein [Bacteroidota bacterium]
MRQFTPYRLFVCALVLVTILNSALDAQTKDTTVRKRVPRENVGIVKSLTVMPYATISYNFQSGQAFPKGAQGVGYGFGLAFDLTEEKQPVGAYFDFAYQDMRASTNDGACKLINPDIDTVTATVPVTHYFSYALFEGFVKLQSAKSNGYFLIGASLGLATEALTVKEGPGLPFYSDWHGSDFYNSFRLDIRGGLGIKLGYISGHQVVFEARFGYPVTTIITDYHDICNGSTAHGSWRAVTMQGNIGLRL